MASPFVDYREAALEKVQLIVPDEIKPFLDKLSSMDEDDDVFQAIDWNLQGMYKPDLLSTEGEADVFSDEQHAKMYVYHYAVTHILDVFVALQNSAERSINYRKWISRKDGKSLNVCSIGGGPGSDVAALGAHLQWLTSWLPKTADYNTIFPEEYRCPGIGEVSILDRCTSWEIQYDNLIKPFFKLPEGVTYIGFIYKDGTKEKWFDDESLNKLKEADVISVSKFVSAILKEKSGTGKQTEYIQSMLQNVALNMKTDSIFLYVDTAFSAYGNVARFALKAANLRQVSSRRYNFNTDSEQLSAYKNVKIPHNYKIEVQLWLKTADETVSG